MQNLRFDGMGLCYETSRAVNIPLNLVSESSGTRHLNIPPDYLLDQFNRGLKIDIFPFHHYKNRSTHWYVNDISFIPRCVHQ